MGFKENLPFARDRLMENYLWAMGITYEPHFSKCRVGLTKFVCILTTIDDIYDVYGSLDELESFTDAVKRYNYYYQYTIHPVYFFLLIIDDMFNQIDCKL